MTLLLEMVIEAIFLVKINPCDPHHKIGEVSLPILHFYLTFLLNSFFLFFFLFFVFFFIGCFVGEPLYALLGTKF